MAVLTVAGALPVRMLAGWRPATPFVAPIGGAVIAGAAGELTVLANGTELSWFVPIAIGANAAAMASWLARREARRLASAPRYRLWLWVAGGGGAIAVASATAWSLRTLIAENIAAAARSIWLAHATWIYHDHVFAFAALRNPALGSSHSNYPPLAGANVALGWHVTGLVSDRAGQLLLAILTGCAVAAAGATILEVGLVSSARGGARRLVASRTAISVVAGGAGVAWVLGVYGIAGSSATDGSVDLLAAACAIAAAGMGLVLPCGGEHGRCAAVLAVAAGLTTDEGIAAAAIVFLLMGARWLTAGRRGASATAGRISRHRGIIGAVACAFGIGGVIVWPIACKARRATPNVYLSGPKIGSLVTRTRQTWEAMSPQLHLAAVSLLAGVVISVFLGRSRRRMGLGSDTWIWVLGAAEVAAVGSLYVIGNASAKSWIDPTARTSALFTECLGLALVAWWCVVAVATAVLPESSGSRADDAPEGKGRGGSDPPPRTEYRRDRTRDGLSGALPG